MSEIVQLSKWISTVRKYACTIRFGISITSKAI